MNASVACPYCGRDAERVRGNVIYPHRPDLADRLFFLCEPCGAYCGTHRATGKPLGTLANATVRKMRSRVHALFDPYWQGGMWGRKQAYARLATAMGIPFEQCHVSMFDEALCRVALGVLAEWNRIDTHDPEGLRA